MNETGGPEASRFLIERAAGALRVPLERLVRKPAWLVFGDMMAGWEAEGCEAERDVWPTISRIAMRLREPPASPAYFRQAILDARDRAGSAGSGPQAASGVEWAERLAVFAADGAWSSRWGPKPGEAGCLAPATALGAPASCRLSSHAGEEPAGSRRSPEDA